MCKVEYRSVSCETREPKKATCPDFVRVMKENKMDCSLVTMSCDFCYAKPRNGYRIERMSYSPVNDEPVDIDISIGGNGHYERMTLSMYDVKNIINFLSAVVGAEESARERAKDEDE